MAEPADPAIVVRAGSDRFGRERRVFGVMPFTVKVTTADSGGGLFVLEQSNAYLGGPARHVHLAQDEWFYVIAGQYVVEVAGTLHPLGPGDGLLAPRGVPHSWALTANTPGRMLVAFSPAGQMEAFFDEACGFDGAGRSADMAALFARHGMRLVGPPLELPRSGDST